MDNRGHHIDAPHNDELKSIDQLADHSTVSATYFRPLDQWEGTEIMTNEARERKHAEKQALFQRTLRRSFPIIGALVPTPFILFALLLAGGVTYLREGEIGIYIVPIFLVVALLGLVSYRALKGVFSIFYDHSIKALPVLYMLMVVLGLATRIIFVYAQRHYFTEAPITNVLIVSGGVLIASVLLTGILLFIWTSTLMTRWKFILVGILALILAGGVAAQFFFS